ncbi:hypothetical protein Tco_0826479 [Tanacetum coccineum]
MPSLPSPNPTVSCFDDLYFFKDFENEYPSIIYNNAPTSKSNLLTEPTLNPQHIDEFDLKDETSLSEYDEEMLFYLIMSLYVSFVIPFDPKRYYKDGVYTRMLRRPRAIRRIQSHRYGVLTQFYPNLEDSIRHMTPLPLREQRHPFLRYQGLEYTDVDIADFEERLERIHDRDTHRVYVVDFRGMPELMRDVLDARMLMEHCDDGGVVVFTS